MTACIGYNGKLYRLSVMEIEGYKHLYIDDYKHPARDVRHYASALQDLAYVRAHAMGLI